MIEHGLFVDYSADYSSSLMSDNFVQRVLGGYSSSVLGRLSLTLDVSPNLDIEQWTRGIQRFESQSNPLKEHVASRVWSSGASRWPAGILGPKQTSNVPFSRISTPIVANSYGAFVPCEFFGPKAKLEYEVLTGAKEARVSHERPVQTPDELRKGQITFEREEHWLALHREEHRGEWVALDGDRLAASGLRVAAKLTDLSKSDINHYQAL